MTTATTPAPPPTALQMTVYFLGLGAAGLGGAVALTHQMRRDHVDTRRSSLWKVERH